MRLKTHAEPAVTAVATHIRLKRAARGDEAAFAALYRKHHQALYRYCRSILHDDEAEPMDASQLGQERVQVKKKA